MNKSDLINGLFEFSSACFQAINVYQLHKDKEVKGVSVIPAMYFLTWGLWNLYFYPANGLIYSFIGGIFIAVINITYIIQLFYFNRLK